MVTAFVLTIVALFVLTVAAFFIAGIRIKAYFDLNTGTFITDLYVFGNLHAVKYKFFECNGGFYGQLNGRDLKKIRIKAETDGVDTETNGSERERGVSIVAAKMKEVSETLEALPRLRFRNVRAYLTIGTGNSMSTSLAAATIADILGALGLITRGKIKAKSADIAVYPNFRYENTVFTLDLKTGAGLFRLSVSLASFMIKKANARRRAIKTKV